MEKRLFYRGVFIVETTHLCQKCHIENEFKKDKVEITPQVGGGFTFKLDGVVHQMHNEQGSGIRILTENNDGFFMTNSQLIQITDEKSAQIYKSAFSKVELAEA